MGNNSTALRRSVLKSIVGNSVVVGAIGMVGASDRAVQDNERLYIVIGGGSSLRTQIQQAGFKVLHELAGKSLLIIQGPEDRRDELQTMAIVKTVIPNKIYASPQVEQTENEPANTNERLYEKQWDKQLVQTSAAHNRSTGNGTTVAIIDTGVSHTHPELTSQIDTNRSRLFRYGRIHSGVAKVRVAEEPPAYGPKVTMNTQPVADDVHGHGTSVAGIASAARNNLGIVGMAPNASIVSLRTMFWEQFSENYTTLVSSIADILLAIDYAVKIGVDVINISLGRIQSFNSRAFTAYRRMVQHAIEQNVVVVAAAGNHGIDLDREEDYILPADTPGTITVASTGPTDKRSYNSNYGNGTVDIAAPGGGYETAKKTEITDSKIVEYPYPTNQLPSVVPEDIYGSQFSYVDGTSIATPQVSGLACLLREFNPTLHPRRIELAIKKGAVELSGEYTSGLGAGRIDAHNTLEYIIAN